MTSSALENGFAVLERTKQLHGTVSRDPGTIIKDWILET
jgi:hypothetical protein